MQLHFQAGENNHIWAFSFGKDLDDCLAYCEQSRWPYATMRIEDGADSGIIVIMSPDVEGHEADRTFLIEHLRKHLTIFSEDLISKISLS